MNKPETCGATIFVKKSNRKNAKCELINMHDVRTFKEPINDFMYIDKIVSTVQSILAAVERLDASTIILKPYVTIERKTVDYALKDKPTTNQKMIGYQLAELRYSNIQLVIDDMYDLTMLINPECTLDKTDLYKNLSIQYIIKNYGHPNIKPVARITGVSEQIK